MILTMSRVRILGPRQELVRTLGVLQDIGLLHLATPAQPEPVVALALSPEEKQHARRLKKIADDVTRALGELELPHEKGARGVEPLPLPRAARVAGRTRRALLALRERENQLLEERALLLKFSPFFATIRKIAGSGLELEGLRIFYLLLRGDAARELPRLRSALGEALHDGFQLIHQPSESTASALLLAVSANKGARAEALLNEVGVQSLPLPDELAHRDAVSTVRRMEERLNALPEELREVARERERIARERGGELRRIQADIQDRLAKLETMSKIAVTPRAFVLEGFIPTRALSELEGSLRRAFGDTVEVEKLTREEWAGEPAPVVLHNPRIFRPFETITGLMPLPKYGTVDPTPFVAVFFPMFFGITLGDVGYGLLLVVVALALRLRSKKGTKRRSIAEIGLACALFSIIFGFLYGELFGDLGHRLGLHPVWFSREETVIPFLGLALALGVVHMVLGLVVGAVTMARGEPRRALGRGVAAAMVVLVVLALLAAVELLPARFFTPLVITLLVAFPFLVILEGFLAPVELVHTLGNILSYARIMAVGTASVMMAVAANKMAGAFGSVVVGALFALLFHLVNFAIGVFSPTIHMLRLHYVEFFGKFFSPGGVEYEPFRHWSSRENVGAE